MVMFRICFSIGGHVHCFTCTSFTGVFFSQFLAEQRWEATYVLFSAVILQDSAKSSYLYSFCQHNLDNYDIFDWPPTTNSFPTQPPTQHFFRFHGLSFSSTFNLAQMPLALLRQPGRGTVVQQMQDQLPQEALPLAEMGVCKKANVPKTTNCW